MALARLRRAFDSFHSAAVRGMKEHSTAKPSLRRFVARSFGYGQRKIVNLTEMRVKFEFFHLNLFVSGPVFDDSSNERGLVRVCGCLGAVLCAGMGVGLLSSV